ncbi:MAG: PQQ-like beta-propeller repeat protein, partial [Planctomycetota bacterium]|nr:PQQ-like beta-propeller repeat protein [Planctomycetota bacterium]
HQYDGRVVWETAETGAPYREPLAREDVMISVRTSPSGVTFRSLGSGRLIAHAELPELLATREHPILPSGGEETPMSFDGRTLLLTDGWDYIAVDGTSNRIKWQKRIEGVDRTSPLPLPFRIRVDGAEIYCLKRSYDTHAMEVFDTETGALLWNRVENKKQPVIYSAVFDEKNIYGLHHEPDIKSVTVIGLDRRSGREVLFWRKAGYEEPEILMDDEMHGRHLAIRVRDKQNFAVILFNVDARKVDAELKATGSGSFGNYGEVSYAVQGRYAGLLSGAQLVVARPK